MIDRPAGAWAVRGTSYYPRAGRWDRTLAAPEEATMSDRDLIGGLIETYRHLNMAIRPLAEERLRSANGGVPSVRDIVRRLRDDELRFSQALKERVTGVPMPDIFGEELPTLGSETEHDTTAMLIAQFGTARESTLAMLRGLTEADWDIPVEGGKPIRTRVEELLTNDRRQLDRITQAVGR
jgi:hypothetical protein